MTTNKTKCIGILTAGGDCPGLNAAIRGVAKAALYNGSRVIGVQDGFRGLVENRTLPIEDVDVSNILTRGGTFLGSSREKPHKMTMGGKTMDMTDVAVDNLRRLHIDCLVCLGGNGTQGNTLRLHEKGINVLTLPKTIDNDLRTTDHCPGYGTAAKFVACAVKGDDLDNRALPGVKIDVIMGRDAGWLTAAAALAQECEDDGPHLVYVPEAPVSMDKFVADVQAVYEKFGRCVVAVSEGIRDADGVTWAKRIAENVEVDSHGNVQLSGSGALADFLAGEIKAKTGIKRVRADTFGYLQRSFAGLQSETDAAEARQTGQKAVEFSQEFVSGSAIMKRVGEGDNYKVVFERTELKNVAEFTKELPKEYINDSGNGITQAFKDYAMPLCGKLQKTAYLATMPKV